MELTLVDFKNHERKSVTLEGVTRIEGRNGAGKTAILEAIVFAFYGRNFYGGIAVDQYVRKGTLSATVNVEMPGLAIKRSFSKGESSLYINGAKARASEAQSLLPPLEVALPIINPLHFLIHSNPQELRAMFMKLLPQRSRVDIFREKYSDDEDLVERFKLSDRDGVRKQRKSMEAAIIANDGMKSNYLAKVVSLKGELKELEASTKRTQKGVLEKEKEKQRELNEIEDALVELGDPVREEGLYNVEMEDLASMIRPILNKYGKENLSELKEYFAQTKDTLDKKVKDLDSAISELVVLISQFEKFESGVCPVCGSKVDEKRDGLAELRDRQDDLRNQLTEAENKIAKLESAIEEVGKIDDEVSRVRSGLNTVAKRKPRYDRMVKRRDEIKSELVGLSEQDFKNAVEFEANRKAMTSMKGQLKTLDKDIEKATEANQEMRKQIEELNMLEEALSPQGVEADIAMDTAKRLQERVSEVFGQKVEIVTVRKNKSNENVREVFDIKVNKVRSEHLSFGEGIMLSVAFGIVAREYLSEFPFQFVMLDEASVLSQSSMDKVGKMLRDAGLDFYYTRATDSDKLVIKNDV